MSPHSWFTVQANATSQVIWCQTCGCLKLDLHSPAGWVPSYRKVGTSRWTVDEPPCAAVQQKEGKAS